MSSCILSVCRSPIVKKTDSPRLRLINFEKLKFINDVNSVQPPSLLNHNNSLPYCTFISLTKKILYAGDRDPGVGEHSHRKGMWVGLDGKTPLFGRKI